MNPKIKQTLELAKNLLAHHANGGDWEAQQSQRVIDEINECLAMPHIQSVQLGNAAKMREVLENSNDLLEELAPFGEWYESTKEQIKENNAALAEPVRNCDVYADELDAQLAFLNEVWLISVDRETMLERDKYEKWTDEMRKRYGRWLLAPAEGGAK